VKFFGVLVAVIFYILVGSYNYTYVDLIPDYSGVKFKEFRFGSFKFELPDFFAVDDHGLNNEFLVIYPNYNLSLREVKYPDITESNKILYKINRCHGIPNSRQNRQDDKDLSNYFHFSAVVYSPVDDKFENGGYTAAFFVNNGCVMIRASKIDAKNPDKINTFKKMVKDFLKHYKLDTKNVLSNNDFVTKLGVIKYNNDFKITGTIQLTSDVKHENYFTSAVHYTIRFSNTDSYLINSPYWDIPHFSRMLLHVLNRIYAKTVLNYRWSHRQGDFNFSPLYSGKEFIEIPIIKNGCPEELFIGSYAKKNVGTATFFDNITIEMHIYEDYQHKNPNFNVVYGYWVRAKNSARLI
jgi:hypothetical protein